MKIPGAFAYLDTMFNNNSEPALALESTAGFATLTYSYLPLGGATPTGLADDATVYTASVDVDAPGTPVSVSVTGSTAQTFTTLIAQINTDLGGAASAALVGSDIVITSATTGDASAVVVTDSDLFSSVKGNNFALQANVSTRGHVKYLRWEKLDTIDQEELYTVMATINPTATDWTYATSGVRIDDATTAVEVSTALTGLAAGTYSLAVTVDGVTKQVSFAVALNSTVTAAFDSFKAAMAVAFPTATVTMVDGTEVVDFMVASPTPGVEGESVVADGTTSGFIAAVDALAGSDATVVIAEVDGGTGSTGSLVGYANYFVALNTVKSPFNGAPILSSVGPVAIVERENKPTMRYIPRADGTYYNGSGWVTWTA